MRRFRLLLRGFHRQNWYRRCQKSTFDPSSGSSFPGHLEEIESRLGMMDPIESQRHYLFPDLGDKKLGEAGSIEEVFDVYAQLDSGDYRQTCQAIATLFHLQKSFRNVLDISINNLYIQYSALNKFNKALHEETPFNELVDKFHTQLPQIPLHVSSFAFLCLSRLGISFSSPLMNEMLLSFQDQFNSIDVESLSYIAVGIRYTVNMDMHFEVRPRIWWVLYMIDALPQLRYHLENVSTPEELNKLTISIFSLRTAMSQDLLKLYLDKVRQVILEPSYSVDEPLAQILIKIASVVENILSQDDNDFILRESDIIPRMLFLLKNHLHLLRWVRLVRLSGLLHRIGEGNSAVREELLMVLQSIYSKEIISSGSYSRLKVMTEILKLEKRSLPFGEWLELTDMILNKTPGPDFYFHVNDILQMSSSIVFQSEEEERRYIDILRAACSSPNENDMLRFFGNYQVNKKYLPPNLRNSPELHLVEEEVLHRLNDSLQSTYVVSSFVMKFSYILEYLDKKSDLDTSKLKKFKAISPQIDVHNLFKLSYSMGSTLRRHSYQLSPNLKTLEGIVQDRICDISGQDLSGKDIIILLKTLRRLNLRIRNEDFLRNIKGLICKLNEEYPPSVELLYSVSELLSTSAEITNPLKESDIHKWIQYLSDNQVYSESFDCIRVVLSLAYRMNIDISKNEDFVYLVHKSIYRNIAYESPHHMIQMALALITNRALSEELIQMIFSLEFMDKIDEEVAKSSNNNRINKLRVNLMRLNRASHLLHPEFQIPWFHQKFCQEKNVDLSQRLRSHGSRRSVNFENSIFDALTLILGDMKFISYDVLSPYFHHIPFEVSFEKDVPVEASKVMSLSAIRHSKQPISSAYRKYALFPRYTKGNLGDFELHSRELQTLGYRVIPLQEREWNSMKMSCDDSKAQYLKTLMGLK